MNLVVGKLPEFTDEFQLLRFEGRCIGLDRSPCTRTGRPQDFDGIWTIDLLFGGLALSERTTALVSLVSIEDSAPLFVSTRLTSGVVPKSPKGSCAIASVELHELRTANAKREITLVLGLILGAVAKVIGSTRLVSCVMMRIRPDGPPKSLPWC